MKESERISQLTELLSDEFLHNLVEVAKLYGWDGDYTEIENFITDLFDRLNKPYPDLEPYEIESDYPL